MNVLLHATSAWLLFLVLRRLGAPGASLAAGLFLLHPVHVESVAWITEQKNTLSLALYLGAALAYLGYDASRRRSSYYAATALFVAGLLTKTIVATLPGALLVVLWWRRGRLSWREDVRPLAPWFLLGAGAGIATALFEAQTDRRVGGRLRALAPRARPARRPRRLVLPRQARRADEPDIHLPAVRDRRPRRGAVPVSARRGCGARGRFLAESAQPCAAGRGALLRRIAPSRARLPERVPVRVLVRGRSLPVRREPRSARAAQQAARRSSPGGLAKRARASSRPSRWPCSRCSER